jgi:hypothetical protein
MKKIIYLFVFLFISKAVQSQIKSVGINLGEAVNSLRGSGIIQDGGCVTQSYVANDSSFKFNIGYSIGIDLEYGLNKTFSIITGLKYERKGAHIFVEATDNTGSYIGAFPLSINLHYASIPLVCRASFGSRTKFFMNGGGYLAYLAEGQKKMVFPVPIPTSSGLSSVRDKTNLNNEVKKFDAGILFGLGISIPLGNVVFLSFELRDNFGLYNINESLLKNGHSIATQSTSLLVGVSYRFKTKTN